MPAYANNGRNRLTGISHDSGSPAAVTYDALGRQLTQTGGFGGRTLTSQHDLAGRRTRLTWPDSAYVT